MIVEIPFEKPEYEALSKIAKKTGMTIEQYVRCCVLECIESEYDLQRCAEAQCQMQTDPQTYTLNQVEEILGIKE